MTVIVIREASAALNTALKILTYCANTFWIRLSCDCRLKYILFSWERRTKF